MHLVDLSFYLRSGFNPKSVVGFFCCCCFVFCFFKKKNPIWENKVETDGGFEICSFMCHVTYLH